MTDDQASRTLSFDRQLDALRPLSDFNQLLHTLRTYELASLPRGAAVFLSAGCAGTWYFDWIDKVYGRVRHHIGIEYFTPKPAGLPGYVTWVANTVGNMEAVADSSADLVFSGQNIEHLWPEDVAGFMAESFRTLKPGGLLVIDSPNRLVTRPLFWNHPQHTMEFTPGEIRTLSSMSGFEVTSIRGIWIVRDPFTGSLLPLDPDAEVETWPLLRRVASANRYAEHSFLWWVEARKNGATPDIGALRQFLIDIYRREWPARLRHLHTQGQILREASVGEARIVVSDQPGVFILFGPYVPLPQGKYTVTFFLRRRGSGAYTGPACKCDVFHSAGAVVERVVNGPELGVDFCAIELGFALPETTFGVEFRVCVANGPLDAKMEIRLQSDLEYLSAP